VNRKVLSPPSQQALIEECYLDPVLFAGTFLREWFPGRLPWYQRAVLAILSGKAEFLSRYGELDAIYENFPGVFSWVKEPRKAERLALNRLSNVVVMLPRGFGKTTLVNTITLHNTVYRDHPVALYLSAVSGHAKTQLENVGKQLLSNELLRSVYGELVPAQRSGYSWSSSEGLFQTLNGVTLVAKGQDGQVRGTNYGGHRPTWIVGDDLETVETVSTPAQRQKVLKWFYGDVEPTLPLVAREGAPAGRLIVIGTLLAEDALLNRLKSDPKWHVVQLGAKLDKGGWLWPEAFGEAQWTETHERYSRQGLQSVFWLEYGNKIVRDAAAVFPEEQIVVRPQPLERFPLRAIALDPAISSAAGADFSAIVVVGFGRSSIQVLDVWEKRGAAPDELIDEFFRMHAIWKPSHAGIEAVAYQAALLHARLAHARAAGCELAAVTTQPGSKSQQNVQRLGFELIYSRAILVHEPEGE
jgi:hypothetical protein